ncbi:MAG: hypothetical protein HFG41_06980 [Coprococcus sp.]|nr:hypothetical protein [Coprococcus sp.]
MKLVKKWKSILMVGVFVIVLSVAYVAGSMAAMGSSKAHAEDSAKEKLEERSEKDIVALSKSFLENSRKFARQLLAENGECPLLDEYAEEHWGNSSLENIMNDVNAGDGAKDAILEVCDQNQIDVKTAKIKDLTEEQIVWIDQEVFRRSDHPYGVD